MLDPMIARNWRDLLRPRAVHLDLDTATDLHARFTCEPLERGYGTTLGNALRRILLSALPGAAISALRIESPVDVSLSLPGVTEDVTDLILNLKEVVFRPAGTSCCAVRLEKDGPSDACAGDIAVVDGLELLNPGHHLATLRDDTRLAVELTVTTGRGYVPAQRSRDATAPVGTIPIDACYSPVRKVVYTVQSSRVGNVIDLDKLVLEVWTNGAVKPTDAVAQAALILREHFSLFINFEEPVEEEQIRTAVKEASVNPALFCSVHDFPLSVRATKCLENMRINLVGELVQKTEKDLLSNRNFGRKSLQEIKDLLATLGLSLGARIDDWSLLAARYSQSLREHGETPLSNGCGPRPQESPERA